MHDSLKKFSQSVVEDLSKALTSKSTEELIAKTKAATDGGTFKVIISTSDEDRQGDSIDQTKWKLQNFENNPVVLWAHDYYSLPIGVCTKIGIEDGKLVAEGKFTPEDVNAFGAQVAKLYDAGFIKTTSVGYMQHENGDLELLEFSFVPVPANPFALSMRDIKKLSLDVPSLVMKGIQFQAKSENAGDPCEQPDGSAGVLAEDPNNPGQLICVPAEKTEEVKSEEEPKPEVETETKPETTEEKPAEEVEQKAGRTISAATKAKIETAIKAVQEMHESHGKSSNDVIAALKDLMGPDEGNEGEEKQAQAASPKPKVEVRGTASEQEFEAIMQARAVLRTIDSLVGDKLKDLNRKLREDYSTRR